MKTNELDHTQSQNKTYRIISHNGTRIKRINKSLKSIYFNNKRYIVPRSEECYATIKSINITDGNRYEKYNYYNIDDDIFGFYENEAYNLSISCEIEDTLDDLSEEEVCPKVILTIFREGKQEAYFQSCIEDDYNCNFLNDEVFPIGKYVAIISGAQMSDSYTDKNYIIFSFFVSPSLSSYQGIKKALLSIKPHTTGSSQPILINMAHCHSIKSNEYLKSICIDSKMNIVASQNIYLLPRQNSNNRINITPKDFWVEDETYTLIIGDSINALTSVTFDISHSNCIIKNGSQIDCKHSNFYKLVNKNNDILTSMMSHPGMSMIREKVAILYGETLKAMTLNNATQCNLIPLRHNLIVESEKPDKATKDYHIGKEVSIYMNNYVNIRVLDCKELSRNDEYSDINHEYTVSVWCNLSAMCENRGKFLPHMIEYIMKDRFITLYDTHNDIKRFFATFPELRPLFDEKYTFIEARPTATEMTVHFTQAVRNSSSLPLTENTIIHIYNHMNKSVLNNDNFDKYDTESIEFFTQTHIMKHVQQRILATPMDKIQNKLSEINCILPEDIDFAFFENKSATDNIDYIMSELNEMVGLDSIKKNIIDLSTQLLFNKKRRELGFPNTPQHCHHMIFTGNPGTGKTTVAKMIGKIFHSLGLLSKGEVITTSRTELIGTYIGQTEEKMLKILNEAQGNVLFIDEAYSLCVNHNEGNDYGKHVIESLLPILSDEKADILIIMAGYQKEMDNLMNCNTGLEGRFPHKWHFDNYNVNELMLIADDVLKKLSFKLSDSARQHLIKTITNRLSITDPNFSNARWIKQQIVHNILPSMAKRVMNMPQRNDIEFFATIETDDLTTIDTGNCGNDSLSSTAIIPRTPVGFRTVTSKSIA